jgi:hypothetical protein
MQTQPPPSPPPPPSGFAQDLIEPPPAPPQCGWFAAVELGIAFPSITRFPDFPRARLDADVLVDANLGYRFEGGNGIQAAWRYLGATGVGLAADPVFGAVQVHSRVENFVFDVDYISRDWAGSPEWSLRWLGGLRVGDLLIESRLRDPSDLRIRGNNDFHGIGGHLGLEGARSLGDGWAVFGKADGGIVWGDARQHLDAGPPVSLRWMTKGPEDVPMLRVQAGVRWTPPSWDRFHLAGGYQYEEWWVNTTGKDAQNAFFPRLGYREHGPFLRLELGY